MKTRTKALLMSLCAMLLVVGSVMGTMAYLTSTDKVVNTFTVGKLAITLDEAKTNDNGDGTVVPEGGRVKANNYKLMPGHHYVKDPTVHLAEGSEACYVYVIIDNQLQNYINDKHTSIDTDGDGQVDTIYEPIHMQLIENNWTQTYVELNGGAQQIFFQKVDAATAAAGKDFPVFNYFDVSGSMNQEKLAGAEDKTITVTAYACQQDGFASAEAAFTAAFGK